MVRVYCHAHHGTSGGDLCADCGDLCADCGDLLEYGLIRLSKCPYQGAKPTCAKCPIHCYQPARRDRVRAVMRYAGPRMLLHHPLLAIRHLMDGFRQPPGPQNR